MSIGEGIGTLLSVLCSAKCKPVNGVAPASVEICERQIGTSVSEVTSRAALITPFLLRGEGSQVSWAGSPWRIILVLAILRLLELRLGVLLRCAHNITRAGGKEADFPDEAGDKGC